MLRLCLIEFLIFGRCLLQSARYIRGVLFGLTVLVLSGGSLSGLSRIDGQTSLFQVITSCRFWQHTRMNRLFAMSLPRTSPEDLIHVVTMRRIEIRIPE